MIEKIKKLLKSNIYEDIILAMELMYEHLTIAQIRRITGHLNVPHQKGEGRAFRIGEIAYIVYCRNSLYISSLPWEEEIYHKSNNIIFLGNHKEYQP